MFDVQGLLEAKRKSDVTSYRNFKLVLKIVEVKRKALTTLVRDAFNQV